MRCFHSAGRSLSVIWAVSGRGARQAVANSNFNFCMFICFCIYDNLPSNDCYKANIAVFLHIILTTVYYNQDMIVSAAVAAVVLEFVHSVIKFSDVFQFTIFRGVPPGILFCAANLAEINFHRTSGIVVYHQIIISTCSDSAVITFSILSCDDRLIGYAFEERESQHQVFQILHLIVARIIQRIIPRFLCTISTTYTRFDKLHDGIMTVSMSERTCKYRPISITTYVIILPQQFVFIVQTMRYFFIDRFTVNHRLHGFHGQAAFYKTPVIFFRIFFDRVVTISETLPVATMSALKLCRRCRLPDNRQTSGGHVR